ncbi:hypothetical protein DB41_EY00060 [Neochlamydia sp. TUME1]|uniref:DUF6790 family protein n=1 Tax=Neochlamydia sp. TUME1 TaxID=1478174 RepID=UPI00057FF91F|nr:DUF6790 family protein [Neochlamydia sp. TUME1]KIC76695.1 hypothetical protein DB41_EY00060 [Neochlamydia sp. TUME1]
MIGFILFGMALVFTLIHKTLVKQAEPREILLSYLLFFNIGIMGLIAFSGHIFKSDQIAALIGWPPGSPFQLEVGVADLAFGVLGILSLYFRGLFWVATVVSSSIFLMGNFCIHMDSYLDHNKAPYNSGILVWFGNLVIPICLLMLLRSYLKNFHSFPKF